MSSGEGFWSIFDCFGLILAWFGGWFLIDLASNFDMCNLSNHRFSLGKTMFFHKITFRGSNDIKIDFDANLAPYCFPKSIQKRWKCRSQEAPDNASIFASFLKPQNLPLGVQLGTILALSFASRRPKMPSRTPLTRLLFLLTRFPFFTYALTFLLPHL